MQFDVWRNEWRKINPGSRLLIAPPVGWGRLRSLEAIDDEFAAVLCGRNAVQISPTRPAVNFTTLAERLRGTGEVKFNDYLLRFRAGEYSDDFSRTRSIIRGYR